MTPVNNRRNLVDREDPQMSISRQSRLLSLNRSGLYYTPSMESDDNLEIMRLLDEQYLETPFYGTKRLLVEFRKKGYCINRKRLRRLMGLIDWQTLYPVRRTTISDPAAYKYPYLLKNINISKPHQVWAIDITYVPMRKGFMYLFAIIDLYSRYVVGWSLSNTMTSEWCIECIKTAISIHGKPEIINSDQGSQFTSDIYVNYLKDNNILVSMDGKGRAIDNVFIERLWRSVKYENIYLNAYETGQELYRGLDNYFRFYNERRHHQNLQYHTPEEVYKGFYTPIRAA